MLNVPVNTVIYLISDFLQISLKDAINNKYKNLINDLENNINIFYGIIYDISQYDFTPEEYPENIIKIYEEIGKQSK